MTELFLHTHTPTHTDSGAHPRSQPFKLPDSGQASHAEQSARFVASTLSCLRPKKRKEKKKAKKTLGFRSRSPKLTASRHVLALKSRCTCLQWSPIVLAVKWATNRPAAAVFVGQNKNRKWEKASGSYRCVFSHCSPSSGFSPLLSVQTSDDPLIPIGLSHSLPPPRSAPCHISPLQQNEATPPPPAADCDVWSVGTFGTRPRMPRFWSSQKGPPEVAVSSRKVPPTFASTLWMKEKWK